MSAFDFILIFVLGWVIGSYGDSLKDSLKNTIKESYEYFLSPTDYKLELNWSVRQLLDLFSDKASQRWYESRAHLHANLFKSILATMGFIYLVRIDLIDDDMHKGTSRVFTFKGNLSFDELKEQIKPVIEGYESEIRLTRPEGGEMSYYQTFIAGYNVTNDFMNGDLV